MIQECYPQDPRTLHDTFGEYNISRRRPRISAWVVVHQHKAERPVSEQVLGKIDSTRLSLVIQKVKPIGFVNAKEATVRFSAGAVQVS